MAIPSAELYGEVDGILGIDPAYKMPVVWINPADKSRALNLGYQVVDCAGVIATHLNKVIRDNLADIFKHDDVDSLMQRLTELAPKLAENLRSQLSYTQQHRVYRQLLVENISVRDIVTGSRHRFDDRGENALKGVPGQWRLYALSRERVIVRR